MRWFSEGADILELQYAERKEVMQHGKVSVYSHSVKVAVLSLFLAELFRVKVNRDAMMRGALLHDYFLYDWHEKDASHRMAWIFPCTNSTEKCQEGF